MTCRASKAYACVAYRIMAYEKEETSEEYLNMHMGIIMDFYTAQEIQKIYDKNIIIDSYGMIMNEIKSTADTITVQSFKLLINDFIMP